MHEGTRYGPQTHSQFDVRESDAYPPTMDGKIKAPTVGRAQSIARIRGYWQHTVSCGWRFCRKGERIQRAKRRRRAPLLPPVSPPHPQEVN